jgi:hypothetical protein
MFDMRSDMRSQIRRRLILDGIAFCGLLLTAYGVWKVSEPLACILVGLGVAVTAEVIGAFPRTPKGL